MGNRPQEPTSANEPGRQQPPSPADDASKSNQRAARQSQGLTSDENRGDPDEVEMGDPVADDQRTIRTSRGGETGEDEDLPGTPSRGETGEDEALPDDDGNIERH